VFNVFLFGVLSYYYLLLICFDVYCVMFEDNGLSDESFDGSCNKVDIYVFVVCVFAGLVCVFWNGLVLGTIWKCQ